MVEITRDVAQKVLSVVDAGLSNGLGIPTPGKMCVEAAVCYALGLPHGDNPRCVSFSLRDLKIRLNDSEWSSREARAKGLRRLAIAQLGSNRIDEKEFIRRVVDHTIRVVVPRAIRSAISVTTNESFKLRMLAAALRCEREGTELSAQGAREVATAHAVHAANSANAAVHAANSANAAAHAAAYVTAHAVNSVAHAAHAAYAANTARDVELSNFAEAVVQILIEMKAPGCQWLDLTVAP